VTSILETQGQENTPRVATIFEGRYNELLSSYTLFGVFIGISTSIEIQRRAPLPSSLVCYHPDAHPSYLHCILPTVESRQPLKHDATSFLDLPAELRIGRSRISIVSVAQFHRRPYVELMITCLATQNTPSNTLCDVSTHIRPQSLCGVSIAVSRGSVHLLLAEYID
jgi:hypothetical protein